VPERLTSKHAPSTLCAATSVFASAFNFEYRHEWLNPSKFFGRARHAVPLLRMKERNRTLRQRSGISCIVAQAQAEAYATETGPPCNRIARRRVYFMCDCGAPRITRRNIT
jgi:hypothetical protein